MLRALLAFCSAAFFAARAALLVKQPSAFVVTAAFCGPFLPNCWSRCGCDAFCSSLRCADANARDARVLDAAAKPK